MSEPAALPALEITGLRIEATAFPPGEKPRNIVLVQDVDLRVEKGKVLGLITLEDVVEEIVGDIEDEHDVPSGMKSARYKGDKET